MDDSKQYELFAQMLMGLPNTLWEKLVRQLDIGESDKNKILVELVQLGSDDFVSAEHYRVFGLNVFPYFSYFVGSHADNYEAIDEQVVRLYRKYGFEAQTNSYGLSPSHIGVLVQFYAHLLKQPNLDVEIKKDYLYQYIFSWIYIFYFSLQDIKSPYFEKLVSTLIQLFYAEWCSLGAGKGFADKIFKLQGEQESMNLLKDKKTGVTQIAQHFVSPARCGFYISKQKLQDMAYELNVPSAFGDRVAVLKSMILESSKYDKLEEFITELEVFVGRWKKQVYSVSHEFELIKSEWIERLNISGILLNELKRATSLSEDEHSV